MCGLCSFRVLFYPVILLYIIVPSMSTLLNKFLWFEVHNIIASGLYILLYRRFGKSSGMLQDSGRLPVLVQVLPVQLLPGSDQRVRVDRSGRSGLLCFCIVCGSVSVAVSASAPVIAGGFRDNAGRGVLLSKLRRRAGCFVPVSVFPGA